MVLLTRQAKRNWLDKQLADAFDELPPLWQFTNGKAELGTLVFTGFDEKEVQPRIEFQPEAGSPRFDLGSTLALEMRNSVANNFAEGTVARHNATISEKATELAKKLRSTDVSKLAFTSHQQHRRALFDGLRELSEGEFKQLVSGKLQELGELVADNTDTQSALLPGELAPRNLCFAFRRGGLRFFVIQEPPRVRTIRIRSMSDRMNYELAMPHVVYVIAMSGDQYDHARIGFMHKPVKSLDEHICVPALPNIMDKVGICMNKDFAAGLTTPHDVCQAVIDEFWSADFVTLDRSRRTGDRFTHDMFAGKVFDNSDATVESFEHWQEQTQKHGVLFGHEAKWIESDSTISDLVGWSITLAKKQEKRAGEDDILKTNIDRIAEALSRELMTTLAKEAPRLPLDDLLKKKIETHVTKSVDEYSAAVTRAAEAFQVDTSARSLSPVDVSKIASEAIQMSAQQYTHVRNMRRIDQEYEAMVRS